MTNAKKLYDKSGRADPLKQKAKFEMDKLKDLHSQPTDTLPVSGKRMAGSILYSKDMDDLVQTPEPSVTDSIDYKNAMAEAPQPKVIVSPEAYEPQVEAWCEVVEPVVETSGFTADELEAIKMDNLEEAFYKTAEDNLADTDARNATYKQRAEQKIAERKEGAMAPLEEMVAGSVNSVEQYKTNPITAIDHTKNALTDFLSKYGNEMANVGTGLRHVFKRRSLKKKLLNECVQAEVGTYHADDAHDEVKARADALFDALIPTSGAMTDLYSGIGDQNVMDNYVSSLVDRHAMNTGMKGKKLIGITSLSNTTSSEMQIKALEDSKQYAAERADPSIADGIEVVVEYDGTDAPMTQKEQIDYQNDLRAVQKGTAARGYIAKAVGALGILAMGILGGGAGTVAEDQYSKANAPQAQVDYQIPAEEGSVMQVETGYSHVPTEKPAAPEQPRPEPRRGVARVYQQPDQETEEQAPPMDSSMVGVGQPGVAEIGNPRFRSSRNACLYASAQDPEAATAGMYGSDMNFTCYDLPDQFPQN